MKVLISVPFSGYVRGELVYEVECTGEESLEELQYLPKELVRRDIVRDDTHLDWKCTDIK